MLLLKNTALLWKDSQRFIFSQPNGSQNFPFPERNSEGKITPNKPQRSLPIFTSYCVALPHQPLLLFPTPETVTRLHLLFQLPLQRSKQAARITTPAQLWALLHKALPGPKLTWSSECRSLCPPRGWYLEPEVQPARLSSAENHISNFSSPRRKKSLEEMVLFELGLCLHCMKA